uniref:Thiamine transporter 2 n=1 Tax=Panagrolaimus superbus TaxID=310955 RepID=A0A914Y811_9BILA
MLGQFFAYSGGQIIYSADWVSYKFLNDFSFGAEIFALGVALICPSVKRKLPEIEIDPIPTSDKSVKTDSNDSVVVVADETKNSSDRNPNPAENVIVNELEAIAPAIVEIPEKKGGFIQEMKESIPKIMSNRVVITWSLWWILTSGMISQLYNYIQILWSTMQDGNNDVYNGVVASVQTAGGAIITFSLQYIPFEWDKHSEIVSFITSIFFGASFFAMAIIWNIYIHYVIFLMTCFCYAILITVAMTVIASQLDAAAYGLVFGANTFFATLLQSLITFAIVDSNGLNLAIRVQFEVYAVCFAVLAIFFLLVRIQKCFLKVETVEEDRTPLE